MANVKSLADLNDQSDHSDDEGGDDFNELYTGGAKSGQVVRGAPIKKDEDDDDVSNLFDRAKRSGAVQGTSDDLKASESSNVFQGTGRTLAGGVNRAAPAARQGPTVVVITFYRNNIFTVNDGPPRGVLDPANRQFIEAIGRGECPEELEPSEPGAPITVNLVRKETDYEEPEKPKVTAFQGTGRTLAGSSSAGPSGGSSVPIPAATAAASEGEWGGVNDSLPTTSLQLRLADGSRMVASFNHTHRLSDIRRFIRAARPENKYTYSLMTGVPPTPIDESEDKTLADAGLLNSVIIQKK